MTVPASAPSTESSLPPGIDHTSKSQDNFLHLVGVDSGTATITAPEVACKLLLQSATAAADRIGTLEEKDGQVCNV
jgi:hypothetical protein